MIGVNHPELVREFASDLTPSSFFDNPIGSSVLMRPMDVVKPPQNQLNKTTPDARLPAPKCEVKHLRVPFENTSVRLSTVTVTQPSLPVSWPRLKGVVNANAYYNPLLPNLFFRFRCQLYMVHTSMDKPLIFLREMVWRVRSLPLLHRRHWRCAASRTSSAMSACSSTRWWWTRASRRWRRA